MDDDEHTWQRACAGEPEAFGEIFDRHSDRVYRQCLRRLASREDAEDLTSSVFIEAWHARDRVRFVDGSALPWLLVVTANLCSKHLRANSRRRKYEAACSTDATHESDIAEEAVGNVDRERLTMLVAQVISTLSADEQQLVTLCDLGELSYKQAAAALSIPVGTVRSRLSRAHSKLRIRMQITHPLAPHENHHILFLAGKGESDA